MTTTKALDTSEAHMILALYTTGYSIADLAVLLVILVAVVALVVIAMRKFEVKIPDWLVSVFWVVVVAVVVIAAIRFVVTL